MISGKKENPRKKSVMFCVSTSQKNSDWRFEPFKSLAIRDMKFLSSGVAS